MQAIKRRSKLPKRADKLSLARQLSFAGMTKGTSLKSSRLASAAGSAKSSSLEARYKDRRASIAGPLTKLTDSTPFYYHKMQIFGKANCDIGIEVRHRRLIGDAGVRGRSCGP